MFDIEECKQIKLTNILLGLLSNPQNHTLDVVVHQICADWHPQCRIDSKGQIEIVVCDTSEHVGPIGDDLRITTT